MVRDIASSASVAVKVRGTERPAVKAIKDKKRAPAAVFGLGSKAGKCL